MSKKIIEAAKKPKINKQQYKKAEEYIKSGGELNTILTKYDMTDKQRNDLRFLNMKQKV